VLVLQLIGKKRWQVYQPDVKLPPPGAPLPFANDSEPPHHGGEGSNEVHEAAAPGTLELEELLAAGDSLYVPRGFFHQAAALDAPSVHLTIGIHVLDEPVRQSSDFSRAIDELVVDRQSGENAKSGRPDPGLLDHETKLTASVGLQFYFSADGSMAGLALGQEIFWMPVCFAPALRFV
jgi:Cupin superfamily protein